MPNIQFIRNNGNTLRIQMDDGTTRTAYSVPGGNWVGPKKDNSPTRTTDTTGNPNNGGMGGGLVTAEMVTAAVTHLPDNAGNLHTTAGMIWDANTIADMFNKAIRATYPGEFISKASRAALVGECCQETDGFKTMQEYVLSDPPYGGYGMIQLTHQSNFAAFGVWAKSMGLVNDENYFVNNPAVVKEQDWAAISALYYFTQAVVGGDKDCAAWADSAYASHPGQWYEVSRAINRGNALSSYAANGEAARDDAINAAFEVTPDGTVTSSSSSSSLSKFVDDFVAEWNGKGCDFDGMYGYQCYDVANQYSYELYGVGVPSVGYARYLYGVMPADKWTTIPNDGNSYPKKGDQIEWDWGDNGAGHVAIVITDGDASGFDVIQQDGFHPTQPCAIVHYQMTGFIEGWHRPTAWINSHGG